MDELDKYILSKELKAAAHDGIHECRSLSKRDF
jgi:hypothetical protein